MLRPRLVQRAEQGELEAGEWTHKTRLLLGLWYLLEHEGDVLTACRSYRQMLESLLSKGIGSGCHETITHFWLSEVKAFVGQTHLHTYAELSPLLERAVERGRFPLSRIFDSYSSLTLKGEESRYRVVAPDRRNGVRS